MPKSEICQSCAYAIQAYWQDGRLHEAPEFLLDYVCPTRVKKTRKQWQCRVCDSWSLDGDTICRDCGTGQSEHPKTRRLRV